MRDWIAPSAGRPSVSLIYNKIIDCITKPLSIKTIWNRELSDLNLSVNWERVWSNLKLNTKENVVCWFYGSEDDNNTELVYTTHVWKNILDP